jgi:hypothetical protein
VLKQQQILNSCQQKPEVLKQEQITKLPTRNKNKTKPTIKKERPFFVFYGN